MSGMVNVENLKKLIIKARDEKVMLDADVSVIQDKVGQKVPMQKSGELIAEIVDDDLQASGTETSIEPNFAVLKFKHTVKKKEK